MNLNNLQLKENRQTQCGLQWCSGSSGFNGEGGEVEESGGTGDVLVNNNKIKGSIF